MLMNYLKQEIKKGEKIIIYDPKADYLTKKEKIRKPEKYMVE